MSADQESVYTIRLWRHPGGDDPSPETIWNALRRAVELAHCMIRVDAVSAMIALDDDPFFGWDGPSS